MVKERKGCREKDEEEKKETGDEVEPKKVRRVKPNKPHPVLMAKIGPIMDEHKLTLGMICRAANKTYQELLGKETCPYSFLDLCSFANCKKAHVELTDEKAEHFVDLLSPVSDL